MTAENVSLQLRACEGIRRSCQKPSDACSMSSCHILCTLNRQDCGLLLWRSETLLTLGLLAGWPRRDDLVFSRGLETRRSRIIVGIPPRPRYPASRLPPFIPAPSVSVSFSIVLDVAFYLCVSVTSVAAQRHAILRSLLSF